MKFHPRTIAPLALALATVSAPAAADANPVQETYRLRVHYHSSELSSPSGAEAVYERIVRAARRTCGGVGRLSLTDRSLAQMCRRELIARAVANVRSPAIAELHSGPVLVAAQGLD